MSGLNDLLGGKKYKDTLYDGLKPLEESCGVLQDDPRLPSYIFPLDFCLGGGIPLAHITQFFGAPGGGKSSLAYMMAKALSKTCMRCRKPATFCECSEPPLIQKTLLVHLEGMPPDRLYFDRLDYQTEGNMIIALPETGEEACDILLAGVESDDCGLVILDSLTNLYPGADMEKSFVEYEMGTQAKLTTRLFKHLGFKLVKEVKRGHSPAVIMISQLRANMNRANKFAPMDGASGGFGQKHGVRLSMRINQLKSEDVDDASGMKDAMRFSVNLASGDCKTQMFTMATKAEYKIAANAFDGYHPGQTLDSKTVVQIAKNELEILTKEKDGYVLQGTPFKFRVLAEIEDVFRTGEWTNPETGEVLPNSDDAIRFTVLNEAKKRAISDLVSRRVEVIDLSTTPLKSLSEVAVM